MLNNIAITEMQMKIQRDIKRQQAAQVKTGERP